MVIGLTGPNSAGKGEAARYFASLGYRLHSLSDIVREEAARQGFPPEREHLIRIGNQLRREGGPGILAQRILPRLGTSDVVDSIRNPAEVAELRKAASFVLLGVTATTELRFERSLKRARPGDPATLAEFEARERQENSSAPESQQLDATFRLADVVVANDANLDSFHRRLDQFLADSGAAARPGPVR